MIPVEVSYLRTIFGKAGQGSLFSNIPLKCRELLSYVSMHFFMDKCDVIPIYAGRQNVIPAGNTIIWEIQHALPTDLSELHQENISINNLNKIYNKLSIRKIIRSLYLTYHAGEVEIDDQVTSDSHRNWCNDHFLLTVQPSVDNAVDCMLYADQLENTFTCDNSTHFSLNSDEIEVCAPRKVVSRKWNCKTQIRIHQLNRWIYFLFHPHYDQISPPGYIHDYHSGFPLKQPRYGIRAGPL
ncbi:MAG: hypothetical protein PHD61_10010 [Bacteroidales bacterium]|nr:hypothetical protein [Lentimicrobiaceae bacterium]MDD5695619.1 hypothetical protein [Bacteroidales bacterium]